MASFGSTDPCSSGIVGSLVALQFQDDIDGASSPRHVADDSRCVLPLWQYSYEELFLQSIYVQFVWFLPSFCFMMGAIVDEHFFHRQFTLLLSQINFSRGWDRSKCTYNSTYSMYDMAHSFSQHVKFQ